VRPFLPAGIGWEGLVRVSTGIGTPEGAPCLIEARQACCMLHAARPMGMGHGSPDEIAGVEAVKGAEHHLAGGGPDGWQVSLGAERGACAVFKPTCGLPGIPPRAAGCELRAAGCGQRARRTGVFSDPGGGIWALWPLWLLCRRRW
jgi:hypothetical protein